MRPTQYMDFALMANTTGAGIPAPVVASGLARVLHGFFRQSEREYAIALPGWDGNPESKTSNPWRVVRVFADDMIALERLMAGVSDHHLVRDYTHPGFPRRMPADFSGPFVEYRRFRVSSRKAGVDELRHRRINEAIDRELPYFQMQSRSNGQAFVLTIEPRQVTGASLDEAVHPDKYGLSTKTRSFGVPHIPAG